MNDPTFQARGPKVFISYSFANLRVKDLEQGLRRRGFRPTVVDDRTLLGKPSLYEALSSLILEADYVVPLVDEAAKSSAWVAQEIALAARHGVPIVPVLHEGVEPDGLFADVPSVLGVDVEGTATRILQDYTCLDFDSSYPAHLRTQSVEGFLRGDKRALVDMDLTLSSALLEVVRNLLAVGHEGVNAQTLANWQRTQEALDELQQVAASYRATLRALGWAESGVRVRDSWNALTRILVGRGLLALAEMCATEEAEAWKNLRDGTELMRSEWRLVEAEDALMRHLLWALGKRTLPMEQWRSDHESPLGDWVRVKATFYTGQTFIMILPDNQVTSSGLRLKEPPHLYLESWDWADFVLPQLVYRGVQLAPERSARMLVSLEEA